MTQMIEEVIDTRQAITERNEQIAGELNQELTEHHVFAVNVMGSPGAGKTSVLIGLIQALQTPCYVIEGDIESDIDTQKLLSLGVRSIQINTGGECQLVAPLFEKAVLDHPLENGVLFIENIGNLVCPAEFMIGEHVKLLVCSVAEGSDKPFKYPLAFEKSAAIVLNKTDLIPYTDFDEAYFMDGVRKLNREAPVFKVSSTRKEGFDALAAWIKTRQCQLK
jgi:hydrogenase nickel incorporation protein HypB